MAPDSSPPSLLRFIWQRPALRSFMVLRGADELAQQMLNVAIGWYVYAATHDPMGLAYVGLARFLPNIVMVLFAGQAADRFDRRRIVGLALAVQALCAAVFVGLAAAATPPVAPVYLLLIVIGSAQAFAFPALSAMLPRLVSEADFPRAVATSSSVFQISTLGGPALGGALYAVNGPLMFAVATALYGIGAIAARRLTTVRIEPQREDDQADKSILGGLRHIRSNRLLLSVISLDLLAVLFGGVTALLPIYAKDILAVGPAGLGVLRCAPAIGAVIIGLVLARRTIERGAGKLMLGCVAGFGVATILFAFSRNFWLSLAALVAVGGFDMVSMVIRQTLVQIATPDAMRGRVSAVYGVSVGASSELGEFESGVTAALFGAIPAAALGGVATLAIVALWARLFPELPRADKLMAER